MADQWFYADGGEKIGPFSSRELKNLADTKQILPTDMIWKEGIARGVAAARVKYLFTAEIAPTPGVVASVLVAPVAPIVVPPIESLQALVPTETLVSDEVEPVAAVAASQVPAVLISTVAVTPNETAAVVPEVKKPTPPPKVERQMRAIAGKGVVLISQEDGYVQYKKKCTVCLHLDTNRNRMKISNGVTHVNYFCPKCRKLRNGDIRGQSN